ncbi:hypothetical protein [Streptomyces hydrogenans]|uniref:hypothetical protein n=1 Tax=Streptomyces hydrogenans TaxID=1873719 RepID=UPI003333C696
MAQARALVADRTRLPCDLAEQLAADPDIAVAQRIAFRPELAPETGRRIRRTARGARLRRGCRHPGCPAALLYCIAASPASTSRILREIARHPTTRSETLLLCLAAPDSDTRRHAAAHPALALPVLESLINAPDSSLARAAASNPALPETVMEQLITRAMR